MTLNYQRRLAASILKCGLNRIWIDPTRTEDVEKAITRADVRDMISSGAIQRRPKIGVSRGRARYRHEQRKKGRRRGPGSRKGAANARAPSKRKWIQTIRSIRRRLRELRASGQLSSRDYRRFYYQAKGGMFKSVAHLNTQLNLAGVLKKAQT